MNNKENKRTKEDQECLSFQEFKQKFYPNSSKKELVKLEAPYEFGVALAQKSLIKLKRSLLK